MRPWRTAHRVRCAGIVLLALAACGEAPPPPPEVPVPPVGASTGHPAPDGRLVAVRARSGAPAGFALDGQVGEWAPRDAPPPTLEGAEPARERDAEAPRPVWNAASHVAVALTESGALLAGELAGEATEGVWIVLRFDHLPLPVLGYWTHGGWTKEAVCEVGAITTTGHELTERDAQECREALAAGEAFATRWTARFERHVRVDARGVHVATERGIEPIADARVAWAEAHGRVTFEAVVPALALPQCGEAPVGGISLAATPAGGEVGEAEALRRTAYQVIEPPVGFAPHADHRALFFEGWRSLAWVNGSIAYQPGEPSVMEVARYASQEEFPYTDRMRREIGRIELVTKERTFGDLEIGSIAGQGAAVWRDGELLGTGSDAMRWVERDGELQGVSWSKWLSDETWTESASFHGVAITADGTFRENLVQFLEPVIHWAGIDEVAPSDDLRTLVIRGITRDDLVEGRRTTIVTWTYDPKTRDWRAKVTHAPRAPEKLPPP